MDDLKKTREDLLEQMETLRRRLANLEVEMFEGTLDLGPVLNPSQRSEIRTSLGASVEILPQTEPVEAVGVNVSNGGVCFETRSPIRFRLSLPQDGESVQREAELVWLSNLANGSSRFGFKFVD